MATYALQVIELARRWRIASEDLLAPLGIHESQLESSGAVLAREDLINLIERTRALTGEPAIGIHLGMQMRISAFGYLGFTAMSAATLGDALALATQFAPVLSDAFDVKLRTAGGSASLVLEERASFGGVRDVVLIRLLLGLAQIGSSLVGRELPVSIELAIEEPSYYATFAGALPPVRFGQPVNQLVADASVLEWPLATADRLTLRLAREQCERELDALCKGDHVVDRVRRVLPKEEGFRTVEQVATAVHMSTRTLKRRLAAQGVTFSSLVDEERRDKALLLLRSADRSINEVARQLGYSTLPAFIRAFARWTGTTPTQYRRRQAPAVTRRAPRRGPSWPTRTS